MQRKDLKLNEQGESLAVEIVQEGKFVGNNLERLGLSEEWFMRQLKKRGVKDLSAVEYAAISANERILLDLKEDNITDTVTLIDKPQK